MASSWNMLRHPLMDAAINVVQGTDKHTHLAALYINSVKGRGLFATFGFREGDFVVEHRGQLVSDEELEQRWRINQETCDDFLFPFSWIGKMWWMDATLEDGSLGRLVNDNHKNPNCHLKILSLYGRPHLCLFALRDIDPGEEITFDYGIRDCPWRKQDSDTEVSAEPTATDPPVSLMQDSDSEATSESSPEMPFSVMQEKHRVQMDNQWTNGQQLNPEPSPSSSLKQMQLEAVHGLQVANCVAMHMVMVTCVLLLICVWLCVYKCFFVNTN